MQRTAFKRDLKVEVNAVVTGVLDFSPAADSHIFLLDLARSWLAASKGSSTDEGWGCEGAADYPNGLSSVMKKNVMSFRTNDVQSVQLILTGTNVTMISSAGSISGLFNGPVDVITTTTRSVDCSGKSLGFSVKTGTSDWLWTGQADAGAASQVNISTNLVQINWTKSSVIMDTPVVETIFLQIYKNE